MVEIILENKKEDYMNKVGGFFPLPTMLSTALFVKVINKQIVWDDAIIIYYPNTCKVKRVLRDHLL